MQRRGHRKIFGQHSPMFMNFSMIIMIIFFLLVYLVVSNYSYLSFSNTQTENISKLVSNSLNTDLTTTLSHPRYISLVMADDSLLKNYLKQEPDNINSLEYTRTLATYLNSYKNKFNLSSAFFVSEASRRYYYSGGIDRVLSSEDQTDSWYFNLIKTGTPYNWNLAYDLVGGQNELTLFVNARILDPDTCQSLGVVGVGMTVDYLGTTLNSFASRYDMKCLLFDENGNLVTSSDNAITSMSDTASYLKINNTSLKDIVDRGTSKWIHGSYVSSTNLDLTGWKIVTIKSSQSLSQIILHNDSSEMLVISVISFILVVSLFVYLLIRLYSTEYRKISESDYLTSIHNRKYMERIHKDYIKRAAKEEVYLFLFDIDHFKGINDRLGHDAGDQALVNTAGVASAVVSPVGTIVRWGGDEFLGFIVNSQPEDYLQQIQSILKRNSDGAITISIGYTKVSSTDSMVNLTERADKALYCAKKKWPGSDPLSG